MNKGFLKLVSVLLLGALLSVPGHAQNYRVKAERYERGIYSPETNPASVRYAIIDLGPDVEPIRLSNSGHVLCQPGKFGKLQSRWYQGQFQELTGGDDPPLVGTLDMNDAGTVVGAILEYKTGSVRGIPPCPDSESAWYRSPSYGIRRAAAWYAGSGAAALLDQPSYEFHIYDCSVPHGPPYTGLATFGSAWTIDDSGHIYGEAEAAYAEHQSYLPPPDDINLPTVPGAAYSGFSFGGAGILGDLSLVYDPAHNVYTTQGKSYYVRKVRNGVTMGYDSTGQNFVNSLPVDFVPTTMNSQGLVLGAVVVNPNFFFGGYTKFLIYDPATRIQTDLPMRASRFFGPGQFHPPVALNHRTIAVTNSSGQTIFKVSPQIVGPEGAVIWEEDPKTGKYFYQSLNLLIPPNSGWTLTTAKGINDNGAIICKGIFQAKDASGNPVGNSQSRACLLVPSMFEVRDYQNAVTPQIIRYMNHSGVVSESGSGAEAVLLGKPGKDGQDTFRLKANVTIHVPNAVDTADANRIAAQWKLKAIQNLTENGAYAITFQSSSLTYDIAPVPGFDQGEELPIIKQFSGNNQSLDIEATDSPGEFRPIVFEGSTLSNIKRSNSFVTWLLAENETTKEVKFLKWTKWRIEFNVDFTVTDGNASAQPRALNFEKVAEGDGSGPYVPVLTPFEVTER